GTVKDRAIAVYRPDLAFSQLFFLVKGILAIYDRQTDAFCSLSGADDPRYVQTNATWSPDGNSIVFARSEAYEPESVRQVKSVVVPQEAAREFLDGGRTFRYDLYRIPFNGGAGGQAEPIAGASQNGMSNYFPKFSPDGKWIVFCRAKSFMLLQPDSELYIIPAEGGQARRLRCNTSRMNSWHSWSPNGRWLAFSSKANTVYTQLFLTHVDEQGRSTPPVVLSHFTAPERAANIPEFVNARPDAIKQIVPAFLNDHNYFRAAAEFIKQGDLKGAVGAYRKSLEMNPKNVKSRASLATILMGFGQDEEAKAHFLKVLEFQPDHQEARHNLAVILNGQGKLEEAAAHCREALRIDPEYFKAHMSLGLILLDLGQTNQSESHLAEAVRLQPKDSFANYYYGHVLHRGEKLQEAAARYETALEGDPDFVPALLGLAAIRVTSDPPGLRDVDAALSLATKACELTKGQDPAALDVLASVYAVAGKLDEASRTATRALEIARAAGDDDLVRRIEEKRKQYQNAAAGQPK
ncbi:MAG: tetratricopeptide repeat protein, partial [Planctomycetota bacterium]